MEEACARPQLSPFQFDVNRLTQLVKLEPEIREVSELSDGYRYRFDDCPRVFDLLVNVVRYEQRYCPFLSFALSLSPHGGPTFLEVKGPHRAKELVRSIFGGTDSGYA